MFHVDLPIALLSKDERKNSRLYYDIMICPLAFSFLFLVKLFYKLITVFVYLFCYLYGE